MKVAEALVLLKDAKQFIDSDETPDRFQPFVNIKRPSIFGAKVSFGGSNYVGTFDQMCTKFMLFLKHGEEYIRLFMNITKKTCTCTVLTPHESVKCDVLDISKKTCSKIFKTLQFDKVDTVLDTSKTLITFKTIRYYAVDKHEQLRTTLPKPKYDNDASEYVFAFPEYKVYVGFDGNKSGEVLGRFNAMLRMETQDMTLHMHSKYNCKVEGEVTDISKMTNYWNLAWSVGTNFLNALDVDQEVKKGFGKNIVYDLKNVDLSLPKKPVFFKV